MGHLNINYSNRAIETGFMVLDIMVLFITPSRNMAEMSKLYPFATSLPNVY